MRQLHERLDCFYRTESTDMDTVSYSVVYSLPGNHYRGISHRGKLFPGSTNSSKVQLLCVQAGKDK